jgi:hypothetical protein
LNHTKQDGGKTGNNFDSPELKRIISKLMCGALKFISGPDGVTELTHEECDVLLTALGIEERLT